MSNFDRFHFYLCLDEPVFDRLVKKKNSLMDNPKTSVQKQKDKKLLSYQLIVPVYGNIRQLIGGKSSCVRVNLIVAGSY